MAPSGSPSLLTMMCFGAGMLFSISVRYTERRSSRMSCGGRWVKFCVGVVDERFDIGVSRMLHDMVMQAIKGQAGGLMYLTATIGCVKPPLRALRSDSSVG